MPRDFLWRKNTDATHDFMGRTVTAGQDTLGREAIGVWAATTAYAVGDLVERTSGGVVLRATVAGTSGAAAPAAPGYGETVVDGGVTWTQVSTS